MRKLVMVSVLYFFFFFNPHSQRDTESSKYSNAYIVISVIRPEISGHTCSTNVYANYFAIMKIFPNDTFAWHCVTRMAGVMLKYGVSVDLKSFVFSAIFAFEGFKKI